MKMNIILSVLIILLTSNLFANEAKLNNDPEIKARFKHLASELRCLKCQNQTIWDSKAGLADDLRKQIRTQIYSGKTDDQIIDYMVERYGDFIRFKPVIDQKNIFLWIGPFLFLAIGAILLLRYIKVRRKQTEEDNDTISKEDSLRVQEILKKGEVK